MSRIPQHLVWMADPHKPTVAGQRRMGSRLRRWWYRNEDAFLLVVGGGSILGAYLYLLLAAFEALR